MATDRKQSEHVLRALRLSHEEQVLAALRRRGRLSRPDLAALTKLSRATLSSIVTDLLRREVIVEAGPPALAPRGRGRPTALLTLNPSSGCAVGLDLARGHVAVCVANAAHQVVASAQAPCPVDATAADRLAIAQRLVADAFAGGSVSVGRLAGIGVGVVGPVEAEPDLASARRQIRDALPDVVRPGADVPVFVDNNTRLAALAEAIWGAGAGVAHLCYLRLSHGVGGGLVVDGHLLGGAWGAAGELGHVSVDPDGPECACGGRGCLERFVNLTTFLDRAGARSIEDAAAAWRAGDPRCRAAVADAGQLLGRALGAAASILNPEAVVLGGELAALGDPLLDAIRGPLGHFGHQRVVDGLQLRAAALGDDSAAQGGVALVLRRSALLAGYPALRPPAAAAS